MKNELDTILKHVLTPTEEAGDILNRRILEQIREDGKMKQKRWKKASVAVAAAAFAASVSITAAAAWYFSAADVADHIGDERLSDFFLEQETVSDEIDLGATDGGGIDLAGESQSYGGYQVTVLGMLSGEGLSQFKRTANGEIRDDRTYCVVAIQREDGTAVDTGNEEFFVSPLIEGLSPWLYNVVTMHGNYSEFVENGVLYRLVECENITCFADHKLYLCVSDTAFFDNGLYFYDEADGSIARNTEYQGLNALFDLELDPSLADPAKAQALIDEIDHSMESQTDADGPEVPEKAAYAMEWAAALTPENIAQYCVILEDSVQTVAVNEEGYFVWENRGGGGGKAKASFLQEKIEQGMWIDSYSSSENGMEDLVIATFTPNADGTLTHAAWVPREEYIK
ncbi:MAG: hypothetical protein NC427_06865 [Ruminococcus flavefaciens]|nr:hypothetical protein [Ruminococcus flavefaciens]